MMVPNVLRTGKVSREARWLYYFQGAFFFFLTLHLAQKVLIPLCFGVLVSFVLYPVCRWFEGRRFGRMISIIIAHLILLMLFLGIGSLLVGQVSAFSKEVPLILDKLEASVGEFRIFLTETVGISLLKQESILNNAIDEIGGNAVVWTQGLISISAFSLLMLFLTPVYSILILYYRGYWMKVLQRLFPSEKREELLQMIDLTIRAYYQFIKGTALVYLIVGILNSIGLWIIGVPHPFLFGFVASVLTFIPYLGIIAGSILPIAVAWITFDSLFYPLAVIGVFVFVQYLEANIIFPLAVSQKLNVNTLIMLLAIFLGGLVWGVAGMILFVPFTGILKLVADHNPRWKTLSMILGT